MLVGSWHRNRPEEDQPGLDQLKTFGALMGHSFRNLLPILLVVIVFQWAVFRQLPEDALSMAGGLLVVVLGIALFLQGLEMGVFPVGRNLSNEFVEKGSMAWLMVFGFCLGFAAVIAEPALIAVATQAEAISGGLIHAFMLRLLVALSVGCVVALGIVRIVLGHGLHWYMAIGYLLVVGITFLAPEEIVGLAYDSGGVTTNIVTVPLVAALGIGLAQSIRGRNALLHGFGLVGMAVMVPMIVVQLYGIVVYTLGDPQAMEGARELVSTQGNDAAVAPGAGGLVLGMLTDLLIMVRDVLPILAVVVCFQYGVIRKPLIHVRRVVAGFVLVILGLYAFVLGLKLGLFPVGQSMAEQLIALDADLFIYGFAFSIGFATTLAEPALIAIGRKAEEAARGRLNGNHIRILVALGVAVGITLGVHRILSDGSIHHYIMGSYAVVILLTLLAPRYIVPLAYDLGGVTTSEVTVPLVTALGIGLATHLEGRSTLIDGFGLIAFASIFPIIIVMLYAIAAETAQRLRQDPS